MSDDDALEDLKLHMAKAEHLMRLGCDAIGLLERTYMDGDLPPDLAVEVGNFLLRIMNMPDETH